MSANELEMKVRELRQLQALIEEAEAEAEAIKDANVVLDAAVKPATIGASGKSDATCEQRL